MSKPDDTQTQTEGDSKVVDGESIAQIVKAEDGSIVSHVAQSQIGDIIDSIVVMPGGKVSINYADGRHESFNESAVRQRYLEAIVAHERFIRWADERYIDGTARLLPMNVAPYDLRRSERTARPKRDLIGVVEEHFVRGERVLILGEPGAGKTTALERLTYLYACRALEDTTTPLPVLIPLNRYDGNLLQIIRAALNAVGGLELSEGQMDTLVANVEALILFDGLNELGGQRELGVRAIRNFMDAHPRHRYAVTCRTYDYDNDLEVKEAWEVQPLDERDVERYLKAHLGDEGGKLFDRIRQDRRMLDLARNPLRLQMIKDASGGGELPQNRGELFRDFVKKVLWREKQKGDQAHRIPGRVKAGALTRLGYAMQRDRTLQCQERQIKDCFVGYLQDWSEPHNWRALLTEIKSNGLLCPEGNQWAFVHEALQEYFAASHLVEMGGGLQILHSWGRDAWARETIVLFLWLAELVVAVEEACRFMEDVEIDLRIRIAAGEILGELGDPRLGRKVKVPAGEFTMGNNEDDRGKPLHKVYVPDFCIDKYPVTDSQYKEFVEATGHRCPNHWENNNYPRGTANHPVTWVDWYDANSYCEWLGKKLGRECRLPTEAEWEKAARGDGSNHMYPWGNDWRAVCNTKESKVGGATPVGLYPQGASPYGVLDMSGNVWEWCTTLYRPYPYDAEDGRENVHVKGERVLRGGAWNLDKQLAQCFTRNKSMPKKRYANRGFRCVYPLAK